MLRFIGWAIFLLALGAVGALASCGCEDVDLSCGGPALRANPSCAPEPGGCNESLATGGVELLLPDLADGDYVLDATADGEPVPCAFSIGAHMISGTDCRAWDFWLRSQPIGYPAAPCTIHLELRHGETVLAGGTFEPAYEWTEPRGEGCGWAAYAVIDLRQSAGQQGE